VISLGGIVISKSIRVSGNALDDVIATALRKNHGLVVGEQTAEQIKLKIGRAMEDDKGVHKKDKQEMEKKPKTMTVKGRDSVQGLPKTIQITQEEVETAMKPKLMLIINMVKQVLEEIPPELASDIIDKGIVMSGGTSLLRNFDKLLTRETGVPCHVAEEAILCVAKGTGMALENLDLYKRAISKR